MWTKFLKKLLIFATLLLLGIKIFPQQDSSFYKNRQTALAIALPTAYVGSMTALYFAWYKDYPQSNFHFFNDNKEWQGMDKAGHMLATYTLANYSYKIYQWSGISKNRSLFLSFVTGFGFQTVVEVLDGFSAEWGASWGDLLANTAGAALFATQQYFWNEQKILLQYSYSDTPESQYRPNLLGSNLASRMLKNYNGISIWASFNIASLLPAKNSFPQYLDLALGYGASGMTGAESNPVEVNGIEIPHFERSKSFYLSPNIRLSKIPFKNYKVKKYFEILDILKTPMPAISYNTENKFEFYCLIGGLGLKF